MQNKGFRCLTVQHAQIQRDRGSDPPPPPENHKTTKPTFNVGAHWSASEAPFKWGFAFCGIWILSTHQLKKTLSELVLQCLGQFERSKVPCAEFCCFYTIVHKDVHLLETSFQTSCVKVIARGQSSPLHTSCDVRRKNNPLKQGGE